MLDFFEEVGGFFAGFFGVVHSDLSGFLGPLGDVFAGVGGGVAGELEGFFGAVGGFDGYGFRGAIDPNVQTALLTAANASTNTSSRVRSVLYAAASSPQYQVKQ